MTILAGVLSTDPDVPIPDSACEALRRNVSRNGEDRRIEFRDRRAFFVKVDIGAYGRPAHSRSAAGSFAMLAGEPLLTCHEQEGTERDVQLAHLHAELDRDSKRCLRQASGTFCAAYYDPRTGTGQLIADRLGLRPLYYAVVGSFVYFASALRILEATDDVPKTMDVRSVVEITGFGYPFGGGTPYAGIRMLEPCELLTVGSGRISSSRYFDWGAIVPSQASQEAALPEVFRLFRRAVRRRLRGDRTTLAYLSGGLDSRCVVAALRAADVSVYTFNFSLPQTQDQVFGLQFAEKVGAIHHEVPTEPGPNWSMVMAEAWAASRCGQACIPERPQIAWTGEGGSVGLGHVYITPEIVRQIRAGHFRGAMETFLRQQNRVILTRILVPGLARRLRGYLRERLEAEVESIGYPDPLRAFYIFLNLNGPRRHLEGHFDTIDRHRLEFQVPFYDAELLEYLTGIAVEPCLYHQLYVKWLSFFAPAVVEVPWQAYPGHVRSLVPVPEGIPDQWTQPASRSHRSLVERQLLARSGEMLSAADFPGPVLRKGYLRLMWWAWKLHLADYGYAMEAALKYYNYWKMSEARYEWASANASR